MIEFSKRTWLIVILSFLFLSISILLPVGCNSKYQDTSNKENLKINETEITEVNLYIDSDLDFYNPAMSSVPGLPLQGRVEADGIIQNVRYHWTTEYGSFLNWDDSGVVTELGSDFFNSGQKVYWSPIASGQGITNEELQINLELEDITSAKVLARAVLIIKATDDGFYVNNFEN